MATHGLLKRLLGLQMRVMFNQGDVCLDATPARTGFHIIALREAVMLPKSPASLKELARFRVVARPLVPLVGGSCTIIDQFELSRRLSAVQRAVVNEPDATNSIDDR